MNSSQPLSVAESLGRVLDGLCRAVAARIASGGVSAALIVLIWGRVQRAKREILQVLARFQAGRLRVVRAAKATAHDLGGVGIGRSGGLRSGIGRAGDAPVLPRGFAWLLPLVPGEAACFAGQITTLLAEPEMIALLEASPHARRVLRPLCSMLGIAADMLRAPVKILRERSDAVCAAATFAPASAPPLLADMRRIKLPRGVLTAVRRHGFGKR
jgi:hypothetical protein